MKRLVRKIVIKFMFLPILVFYFNSLKGQNYVLLINKDKSNKYIKLDFLSTDKNSVDLFTLNVCDSILIEKRKEEIRIDSLAIVNSKPNVVIKVKDSYTNACNKFILKQIKNIPQDKKYYVYSSNNYQILFSKHVNEKFYFIIIENSKTKYYEGKILTPRM